MRITESKLRRIIREELLRESRWRPEDWWEARHPLAQVYRIPGAPTIKRLKELGRLVVHGSLPGIEG